MKNPIVALTDGFKNIMKGLGGSKDPRMYNDYQKGLQVTQIIANNLYVYNWLAAKVVDIPIDDATRKWRTLLISDPDEKDEVETLLKDFCVKDVINLAFKWARVFGGAGIIAVIDGDDQEEPLEVDNIRPETLKNFIVLDRYNLYTDYINRDILSDNYGKPEYYTVARGGQKIHHTRVYRVMGDTKTIMELEQQNYWGNSIFTSKYEPISDSQVVSQSIANLIYEANVDVYKIKGLHALVAEGRDDIVVKRLQVVHEMKSIINGVVLDGDDEYEKKQNSFMQLSQIDDRFIQKVAGAANIPVTRLLGISPAGMNATGESDMLNYYDNIQSIQENDLKPAIDWVDSIVLQSSQYDMEEFNYEFLPLKQLTEIEESEVGLRNAQRDQVYLDNDVIQPSDAIAQLVEKGTYVSIDEKRVEEEKAIEELEGELGALEEPTELVIEESEVGEE